VTSPEQSETLHLIESKFAPIERGGLAHVGIGVATGCDRVFIVGEDADIESERLGPLVMRDDIERGHIRDAGRLVINTLRDEGGPVDLHDYPKLARYLKAHAPAIRKRHVAKKAPANWFRTIDRVYPKPGSFDGSLLHTRNDQPWRPDRAWPKRAAIFGGNGADGNDPHGLAEFRLRLENERLTIAHEFESQGTTAVLDAQVGELPR
jgi:hypothetical protein